MFICGLKIGRRESGNIDDKILGYEIGSILYLASRFTRPSEVNRVFNILSAYLWMIPANLIPTVCFSAVANRSSICLILALKIVSRYAYKPLHLQNICTEHLDLGLLDIVPPILPKSVLHLFLLNNVSINLLVDM